MELREEQSVLRELIGALHVAHEIASVLTFHVSRGILACFHVLPDLLVLRDGDDVVVQADEVDLLGGVVAHDVGELRLGGGVLGQIDQVLWAVGRGDGRGVVDVRGRHDRRWGNRRRGWWRVGE